MDPKILAATAAIDKAAAERDICALGEVRSIKKMEEHKNEPKWHAWWSESAADYRRLYNFWVNHLASVEADLERYLERKKLYDND